MGEGRAIKWSSDDASSTKISDALRDRSNDSMGDPIPANHRRNTSSSKESRKTTGSQSPYPSSQTFASSASLESYTSSASSISDPSEQLPKYHASDPPPSRSVPEIFPATPRDFAELFPSSTRYILHHDDATMDGNMNLRVDAPVTTSRGVPRDITLFHLRMYDLKCRDFSLRRYCRDSGREVCHCVRKSHKSILGARPNIQRSLSNALSAMIPKQESKQHQAHGNKLQRQDSDMSTTSTQHEEDGCTDDRPHSSHSNKAPSKDTTDIISLEFSNYAHVELKRRGFKADKRYDFDYWGVSYSWQRFTQKLGNVRETSYHLTRRNGALVARIVPEPLSDEQASTEARKGGWIPPCSLRIVDKEINEQRLADVADVIISTGLVALADDSIRKRFNRQEHPRKGFHIPMIAGGAHHREWSKSTGRLDGYFEKPHRKLIPVSL